MASSRGVKFSFSEGEKVLCFEPDPTKAKVLYEAKILEINVGKDKNGKRIAEYLVHFNGWNSSWDRIVGEDHVYKYTEENIEVMRKLADVVKSTKKNKVRKKKIDDILKRFNNECSEDEEESSTSNEESDEESSEEEEDSDDKSEDLESLEESEDEKENEAKEVIIEIPDTLRKQLEHDMNLVTSKNKCVRLPAEPNVMSVLEGFVKNYAINVLVGTVERRSSYSAEHRIDLCKEVMDGLRIFFDFLLPTHLLYNEEKGQYKKLISAYKAKGTHESPPKVESIPEPAVSSPRRRTRHSSAAEHAPKLAKLSPRVTKKEAFEFPAEEKEEVPRRITRHAAAEEETKKMSEKKAQETRGARHKVHTETTRATPPPPLLIPNVISTKNTPSKSNGRSTPVKADNGATQSENEAIMNEMLLWRLVPEEVLQESLYQPSQIYGCHHLLRLFVKLPEFLSLMNIPDIKLRTLLRYFDNLLEYLCNRHSEFMPSDSYIPSSEYTKHAGKR